MRSTTRDQGLGPTIAGGFDGSVASGGGVSNGVVWSWVRNATGDYTVRFDPSLVPLTVVSGAGSGYSPINSATAGSVRFQSYNVAGALANGFMYFNITTRRAV